MAENLDLLGDPIPENWGGRGRPPHIPTVGNRNKVIVLLALEWDEAKIAASLGITKPTLKKHYFRELKVKEEARARLEAELVVGMAAKALGGDVPAYREVRRVLDKADVGAAHASFQSPRTPGAKSEKLGKKAERQAAAAQVDGKFAPGAPPSSLISH
jgi:hypothetical protein